MSRRKKFAAGPLILLSTAALLLIWGTAIEPRFLLDVEETTAAVPGLYSAWEGQRFALIADLQVGMWWGNTGMVRRVVNEALEARPAMALIAGDFVYEPDSSRVRLAVELVRPLAEAGVPTYAVLGNHDYALGGPDAEPNTKIAAYLEEQLEGAGIIVLENESARVNREGAALYVTGIGSHWAGRSRPRAAAEGIPEGAPRVVFMHNPISFRELRAYSAPAAFAAHTHGGQIRIPYTPSESWLHIALQREVIADGWAADTTGAEGNRAYVNRGIGFSVVPIRIFCRPELTLVTLRSHL